MSLAKKYWDAFYTKNSFKSGKEPSPFLQEMLPRLQKGKALDVGMGEGVNAVYLAKNGFEVKGFDISPVAVERAASYAKDNNAAVECKGADLDLFLFKLMEYHTVIMTYFKPAVKRYYSELIRTLKQGGTVLVESYLLEDRKEIIPQDEAYRDYYFKPNELLHHLKGLRILYYNEGLVDGRHVLQCVAQKPMDKDVAKYNAFDMGSGEKPKKDSAREALEAMFKKKD